MSRPAFFPRGFDDTELAFDDFACPVSTAIFRSKALKVVPGTKIARWPVASAILLSKRETTTRSLADSNLCSCASF